MVGSEQGPMNSGDRAAPGEAGSQASSSQRSLTQRGFVKEPVCQHGPCHWGDYSLVLSCEEREVRGEKEVDVRVVWVGRGVKTPVC